MNILFVHSCRDWGGGEVSLTQIANALTGRGHHVTVACHPRSALWHRCHPTMPQLLPLRISGDFDPITIGRLCAVIRRRNIDLVCVHTNKELRLAGIASLLMQVPIVVSREVDFPIKNSFLNRLFYGRIAVAIIVNSFATKNTLLISAPWLQKRTIRVVWKGIDPARFNAHTTSSLREELKLAEGDILAGFVGRLDEQKGIRTLLEAMSLVVQSDTHVKLVLAGDGNLRRTIEEFCRENNLERNVFLAGFREDIPDILGAIDFLVMPSNWEGFGYAVVEAMAAGKPVIASHVSSLPEIVDDSRTGVLVPPRSPERLAEAMLSLVRNPPLRRKMGDAGARKVNDLFTLSTMIEKIEASFVEALRVSRTALRGPASAKT